jgi:hypothetical protein
MSGIPFTRTPNLAGQSVRPAYSQHRQRAAVLLGLSLLGAGLISSSPAAIAQVFTVGSERMNARFDTIKPTNVELSANKLDSRNRQELVRLLDAEQGFAMRPLPKGSHGLVIRANGDFEPNGSHYLDTLDSKGIAIRPGERIIISDVKFDKEKIIFDLNGGPDEKHHYLRHIQIGIGGMSTAAPQETEGPAGSRLTLTFDKQVPEMTGLQVEELLAPMIDFHLKTPVQAFADALPPKLKKAVLDHQVLVGMSVEMLVYSKGQPGAKSREMDGQMPFEEWIYGTPPAATEFVRINGNRVIRVEVAEVGKSPVIRAENECGDSVAPVQPEKTHVIAMGDNKPSNDQVAKAPPTLIRPGETLPTNTQGTMGKVQFPKDDEKPQAIPPPPGQSGDTSSMPPLNGPKGQPLMQLQ